MKCLFIIGIRRSGTSVLRQLLAMHPKIGNLEFEPHDLWAAVDLAHFDRLMKKPAVKQFVHGTIGAFRKKCASNFWYGAKFALNPGTKALEWRWLYKTFPEARFVFIERSMHNTWASVSKQDVGSVRGIIDRKAYETLSINLRHDFTEYVDKHPNTAIIIKFEDLLIDPNKELNKVTNMLGLGPFLPDLRQYIRKPEHV